MSAPHGRPKARSLPLGGTARSAKGAYISAPHGRPKARSLPLITMLVAMLVTLAFLPRSGLAQTSNDAAENSVATMKTERFRRLASELRCLVCQNQSLVDSNAPLAQDLRVEVVKLMASGRDDRQIKSYLVDRYGEFVLYRPELSSRNALLWFGPFLLLVIGAIAWWRLGRRKPEAPPSAPDALKHVDDLLGR